MADYWAAHGNSVTILSLRNRTSDEYSPGPGVKIIYLNQISSSRLFPLKIFYHFKRIVSLRRNFRFTQADIIFGFLVSASVLSIIAAAGTRKSVVACDLSNPFILPGNKIWRFLRNFTFLFAGWIVVQNKEAEVYYKQIKRKKCSVIYNPAVVPERGVYNTESKIIAAVGRLEYVKGFDILLRAFAECRAQFPDWSIQLAGEGSQKEQLILLAEKLNLSDAVQFMGWIDEPWSVLSNAGCFVLPSRYEGFPLALIEAMACGLPVISADCPSGPREVINSGKNGLLFPAESVSGLAEKLRTVLDNIALRKQMSINSAETARAFTVNNIMRDWEKVLQNCTIKDT